MNTDEMRYFLAVCDEGSISKAASRLSISPQGLGASIRRFEKKLGVRLFVRTPLGTVLTDDGTHLRDSFDSIVAIEDEVLTWLAHRRDKGNARHLVGRDSLLGEYVARGVANYNKAHPDTPVEVSLMRLSESDLARVLVEGGNDYRFCSLESDVLAELPHARICTLRFIPVANKDSFWARQGRFTFEGLRKEGACVYTKNTRHAWLESLVMHCRRLGIEIALREREDEDIVRLLCGASKEGIAFVRSFDWGKPPWDCDDLVALETDEPIDMHVILQTTHDSIDEDLLADIRASMAQSPYDI